MTRSGKPLASGLVAIVLTATLVLAVAELGGADTAGQPSPQGTFSMAGARTFADYPVYYAGESVDGIPLVAVLRRNDTANYVSFIYGTCIVDSDTGCVPPRRSKFGLPACEVLQATTRRSRGALWLADGSSAV